MNKKSAVSSLVSVLLITSGCQSVPTYRTGHIVSSNPYKDYVVEEMRFFFVMKRERLYAQAAQVCGHPKAVYTRKLEVTLRHMGDDGMTSPGTMIPYDRLTFNCLTVDVP